MCVIIFSSIGSILADAKQPRGISFNSLVGQACCIAYIYIRSGFNEFIYYMPITVYEMWGLAILILSIKGKKILMPWPLFSKNAKFELAFLFALISILVICELPKNQMLSSDPDQHMFFASQINFLGGIPFHRLDWGGLPFNYPAGTGALIYAWSIFSFLQVSAITIILPLMETILGVLAVAAWIFGGCKNSKAIIYGLFFLVLTTMIGFNFPLMADFFHQEGFGRQAGIGFLVLFVLLWLGLYRQGNGAGGNRAFFLMGATIFVLISLNPVNIIIPLVFIFYTFLIRLVKAELSYFELLVFIIPLGFIFFDPYYLNLILGQSQQGGAQINVPPFTLNLVGLNLFTQALFAFTDQVFLGQFFGFLISQKNYIFLLVFVPLFLFPIFRCKKYEGSLVFALSIITIGYCASFFYVLRNFSPFYLLYPYLIHSLSQYKVVAYQLLLGFGLLAAFKKSWPDWRILLTGIFCSCIVFLVMSAVAPTSFKIRKNYCGSLGCTSETDIKVLLKFKDYQSNRSSPKSGLKEKILVPNILVSAGSEEWIFPFGGARVLPLYNIAPLSFYYFQGSTDYTVRSYRENICNSFNLDWLKKRQIRYIFLPSDRGPFCIHNIDQVVKDGEVIIRDGESLVIKIY